MKKEESAQSAAPNANSQAKAAGFSYESLELSILDMLKAGVHFGHKSSRWNPKMKDYTFGVRNNVHIINLEKSLELFEKALEFIRNIVSNGGKILFVGTKPQSRKLIESMAHEVNMPFVSNRWLGGTFTNFEEIKKRVKYLIEREELAISGELKKYTKYEQSQIKKEISKMNEKMGGIKTMDKMPQAIFVIDIKENVLAVREARKAGIPTIALADTNCDPTLVDYPIPANDDALSSLKYMLGIVAKNIMSVEKNPSKEGEATAK